MYNFSTYPPSYCYYGGSDQKKGVCIDGSNYMVKLANTVPVEKKNSLNSSTTNTPISEYISCHIIETLGLPVQETLLGVYDDNIAVACKDFTEGNQLIEFSMIENQVINSSSRGRTPILDNVEKTFESDNFNTIREEAKKRFWDTFVIDALLGNFDRHSGNWGYLQDPITKQLSLAPIYDCGSTLYPGLGDHTLSHILSNADQIADRINVFPSAALILHQGEKKIGYKDMFFNIQHPDCMNALCRVMDKIDLNKINQVIENTPLISDIRKEFYRTMIAERYKQIILEPYLQLSKEKNIACFPNKRKPFAR